MKISDFLVGWAASEVFSSWRNKRARSREFESYGNQIRLNQNSDFQAIAKDPWGADWDPFVVDKAYSSNLLLDVYKEPDLGSLLAGYVNYYRECIAKRIVKKVEITYEEVMSDLTFNLYINTIIYLSVCSMFTHMISSSFDRMRIFGRANNLIISKFVADGLIDDGMACAKLMEKKQEGFCLIITDADMLNIYSEDYDIINIHKEKLIRYLNEFYDPNFSAVIVDNVIPESWVFKEDLVKAVKSVFQNAPVHENLKWTL